MIGVFCGWLMVGTSRMRGCSCALREGGRSGHGLCRRRTGSQVFGPGEPDGIPFGIILTDEDVIIVRGHSL